MHTLMGLLVPTYSAQIKNFYSNLGNYLYISVFIYVLNLLGRHQLTKLHRLQGHNYTAQHLYGTLCSHHSKSSSVTIYTLHTLFHLAPFPLAISILFLRPMNSLSLFFSFQLNPSTLPHSDPLPRQLLAYSLSMRSQKLFNLK